MQAFFIPGLIEMWVACGTKFGKTLSGSIAMCSAVPLNPQTLFRWVAPINEQSKIGFKYCKRMLPNDESLVKSNEAMLSIKFIPIDSTIQFFHGQYPETLEGEAVSGTILDEAAKMKEQVYASSKTTTTVTRGPIVGISTPRGKNNWFYRKCMEAKEEMMRAKHEGRMPTKIFIHAPSTANPTVSLEIIEDARRSLPDRLFRQYYLADFVADGSIFTNLHENYTTDYIEVNDQFQWFDDRPENRTVVIGADWARSGDYTVFIATDIKDRKVVGIWRMQKIPYPVQVDRLKAFSKRFKDVETVWHDKTGVGVALDDMLHRIELPFHGLTFSNASKNDLMAKAMVGFESKLYGIPHIDKLASELSDIEVGTTSLGLPTYAAPSGSHDDLVMALVLSHAAMLQHVERDFSIMEF